MNIGVTGASGHLGSATVGDFDEPETLMEAFRGLEGRSVH
jgi:hypothetical protein